MAKNFIAFFTDANKTRLGCNGLTVLEADTHDRDLTPPEVSRIIQNHMGPDQSATLCITGMAIRAQNEDAARKAANLRLIQTIDLSQTAGRIPLVRQHDENERQVRTVIENLSAEMARMGIPR